MNNLSSLGVLVGLAVGGSSAEAAPIDLSTRADVYFSNPDSPDQVSATLTGASCDDAVFAYSVHRDGVRLFRRVVPMRDVLPCDWLARHPEQGHWAMLHVLNGAVSLVRASDRGCGGPRPTGCWAAPIFEGLQKANAPLMCFSTGTEASSCVGYDPDSQTVVEVRRYSE